jgi:hypothetical protein
MAAADAICSPAMPRRRRPYFVDIPENDVRYLWTTDLALILLDYAQKEDEEGVRALVKNELVFELHAGTRLRMHRLGRATSRVTVLDGAHAGRHGKMWTADLRACDPVLRLASPAARSGA